MTVKDLIVKLIGCNPDQPVVISGPHGLRDLQSVTGYIAELPAGPIFWKQPRVLLIASDVPLYEDVYRARLAKAGLWPPKGIKR